MSEQSIDEPRKDWNEAVERISQAHSWQSAAAMKGTAYGKAKRLIAEEQKCVVMLKGALEDIRQTLKVAFEYREQAHELHLSATMLLDYDQGVLNEIAGYCDDALHAFGDSEVEEAK